jgi:hypothetical protein
LILRVRIVACVAGVVILLLGCQSARLGGQEWIVQLNLITVPVALDLDNQPGVDGISVKVYASAEANPKPVPIRAGSLELLLFDGPFHRQASQPPILKQFRFTPDELRPGEFTAKIGTGYQLSLAWGTNIPSQRIMSVAARYTHADGQMVLSRPSSVTVLAK